MGGSTILFLGMEFGNGNLGWGVNAWGTHARTPVDCGVEGRRRAAAAREGVQGRGRLADGGAGLHYLGKTKGHSAQNETQFKGHGLI